MKARRSCASADVTVWAGALPLGTVLWSNSGDGSGVDSIVPAVPSPSGVADVFAFQRDGTVQAITSDGATAWTANISWPTYSQVVPDFQGGLAGCQAGSPGDVPVPGAIVRYDGITGQPYPAYIPDGNTFIDRWCRMAVHPDGTIFTVLEGGEEKVIGSDVIGIDPTTGTQKLSVPMPTSGDVREACWGGTIVAGDGYAYVPYGWTGDYALHYMTNHLRVLRVNSAGASDVIQIMDWPSDFAEGCNMDIGMITEADTGILLTYGAYFSANDVRRYMAITTGASASVIGGPGLPGGAESFVPVLQAQDGSFVGTAWDDTWTPSMVAFDASGSVRWSVRNEQPQIATDDGGVIGQSGITYDQNGSATGQINLATYSWTGNAYQRGSVRQVLAMPLYFGVGFWPFKGANDSGNGTAHFRMDSVSNDKVKNILTPARWQKFAQSNCSAVFANPQGLPLYDTTMRAVQKRQSELNFYNVGNPEIGNLTLQEVTAGMMPSGETLTDYLNNAQAAAAVPLLGRPGPVVLQAGFFSQPYPQFTLVHEVLLHSYAGQTDGQVLGNAFFQQKGLWNDGKGSTTISTWMSTDCTCTPGNPANKTTCQLNTAGW